MAKVTYIEEMKRTKIAVIMFFASPQELISRDQNELSDAKTELCQDVFETNARMTHLARSEGNWTR